MALKPSKAQKKKINNLLTIHPPTSSGNHPLAAKPGNCEQLQLLERGRCLAETGFETRGASLDEHRPRHMDGQTSNTILATLHSRMSTKTETRLDKSGKEGMHSHKHLQK